MYIQKKSSWRQDIRYQVHIKAIFGSNGVLGLPSHLVEGSTPAEKGHRGVPTVGESRVQSPLHQIRHHCVAEENAEGFITKLFTAVCTNHTTQCVFHQQAHLASL